MELRLTFPQKIIFGCGAFRSLAEEIACLGKKPLGVTGQTWFRASGRLDEMVALLARQGLDAVLFEGVEPEPQLATVQKGMDLMRASGADCVVAVGGGSVIDVGKAVACLAAHPGKAGEYFRGREVPAPGYSMVAVPTTAGTGAEATKNAVILDPASGEKTSIRSEHMIPRVAIVDPELAFDMPPEVTAQSGMDAFTQAVESYVSTRVSPATEELSFSAAGLVGRNLLAAYRDGSNREAREAVALGSLLAGMALNNAGLGLVHGLAHPLGAAVGIPHGLVCAILLPPVIEYNHQVCAERYAALAREVGAPGDGLAAFARSMNATMGIPAGLSQFGLTANMTDDIAARALKAGSTRTNPKPPTREDVKAILFRLL